MNHTPDIESQLKALPYGLRILCKIPRHLITLAHNLDWCSSTPQYRLRRFHHFLTQRIRLSSNHQNIFCFASIIKRMYKPTSLLNNQYTKVPLPHSAPNAHYRTNPRRNRSALYSVGSTSDTQYCPLVAALLADVVSCGTSVTGAKTATIWASISFVHLTASGIRFQSMALIHTRTTTNTANRTCFNTPPSCHRQA